METTTAQLLSLPALATALNLPEAWIKAEADAGRLPHLRIGTRYRFNRDAVLRTLAERAAVSGGGAPCPA
jgi:excisionase family DNA binding protein